MDDRNDSSECSNDKIVDENCTNKNNTPSPDDINDLDMEPEHINIVENQTHVQEIDDNTKPTDDLHMEVEESTTTDNEAHSKKSDQNNKKVVDDNNCSTNNDNNGNDDTSSEENNSDTDCIKIDDNNFFGSHILSSKPTKPDDPPELISEQPSSFAMISESYIKSRTNDNTDNVSKDSLIMHENSSNCELDSSSAVTLPKGKLPSTLSMISQNYQDTSSDDETTSSDNNNSDNEEELELNGSDNEGSIISISSHTAPKEYVKTKGELTIHDLPPIEDLKISVDEKSCKPIGCIKSIVDTLVVVEGFINIPAMDIDSVIFVDRGQRALGRIFDVFGPVNKPYYAIRFNDSNHIKNFNIQIKETVYCADKAEYTNYVLVSKLLEMKGSDASWKHNNEPPIECLDYSDDEQEKLAKKNKRKKKGQNSQVDDTDNSEKSPEPPKKTNFNSQTKPNTNQRVTNNYTNRQYTPRSSTQYSNRPPPIHSPGPSDQGYGYRPPPTYAQRLSSMEYGHYHPPPNSYHSAEMYPPRHTYGYPHPYVMPPRSDYVPQRPTRPIAPGRLHYPDYPHYSYYPDHSDNQYDQQ